jgi:Cys-tRNA(Pro) deacylase
MASASLERFLASARDHDVRVDLKEFPAGTRTAAAAAAAIGCDVSQIVKSLVFMADDVAVLALASGSNRVDEAKLAAAVQASSVRKADADEVRRATGYAIGGTPPFGHTSDLQVVCDRDLTAFDEVWAAAGTPATVFGISPDTLLRVTGAPVVDLAG